MKLTSLMFDTYTTKLHSTINKILTLNSVYYCSILYNSPFQMCHGKMDLFNLSNFIISNRKLQNRSELGNVETGKNLIISIKRFKVRNVYIMSSKLCLCVDRVNHRSFKSRPEAKTWHKKIQQEETMMRKQKLWISGTYSTRN